MYVVCTTDKHFTQTAGIAAKTNPVGGMDADRCDELDNRRESSVDNDKREDPER